MVVGNTTISKGNGRKGTRSTSKKKKQPEESSESSDEETKAEASVTERSYRATLVKEGNKQLVECSRS